MNAKLLRVLLLVVLGVMLVMTALPAAAGLPSRCSTPECYTTSSNPPPEPLE